MFAGIIINLKAWGRLLTKFFLIGTSRHMVQTDWNRVEHGRDRVKQYWTRVVQGWNMAGHVQQLKKT